MIFNVNSQCYFSLLFLTLPSCILTIISSSFGERRLKVVIYDLRQSEVSFFCGTTLNQQSAIDCTYESYKGDIEWFK